MIRFLIFNLNIMIHKIKVRALKNLNWYKAGDILEVTPAALPYFLNNDMVELVWDKEKVETEKKEIKKTKNKAILKPKKTK